MDKERIQRFLRKAWSKACQDKPSPKMAVEDGQFRLTITKLSDAAEICKLSGVPSDAHTAKEEGSITYTWHSHADAIFGANGILSKYLDGYEVRASQLYMARLVQRAIEAKDVAIVEAATGVGKCLSGDTLITLSDGTQRKIADLVGSTEHVLNMGPNLIMQYAGIKRCWKSGSKPVLSLKTQAGNEIKASPDHRFYTVDGWKTLGELSTGDSVAMARNVPEPVSPALMRECDVRFLAYMISDGGCTQAGLAGKSSHDKFIPDEIFMLNNKQLAIFLGCLISGDGTVDAQRRVIEYYSVSRQLVMQVQHLLLRLGILSTVAKKNGRYKGERHESWRLTISGTAEMRKFRESIELVGDKMDSLLSMDLSKSPNTNIDTVPIKVLRDVTGLKKYGVGHHHKGVTRQRLKMIADDTGNKQHSLMADSDIYWDTITSIEDAGIADTYDIEMFGNPNFVANRFVVHNSWSYSAVAMAMGKRIVISTSNKALQSQLYKKDIPFLQTIFKGKKVALVQGKKNYACRAKCQDQLGETTIFDTDLRQWYQGTDTGNLEEISFAMPENEDIAVDDYCTGCRCSLYDSCFYFAAKQDRMDADVLIINHAMLALHYRYPAANILPPVDVVVVDEAHQFPAYARGAMEDNVTFTAIDRAQSRAAKYDAIIDDDLRSDFATEIQSHVGTQTDRQIGIKENDILRSGITLAQELWLIADEIFAPNDLPNSSDDMQRKVDAEKLRAIGVKINSFSRGDDRVRWIENNDNVSMVNSPADVSKFIGGISGYLPPVCDSYEQCLWCKDKLTGPLVHIDSLNNPSCGSCIDDKDPMRWDSTEMPLAEWLAMDHPEPQAKQSPIRTPIIFASATLATPDMAMFQRECGIPNAMTMIAKSPFDYDSNALLYVPGGNAPEPNDASYQDYLVDQIKQLVECSGGGALCLFTSFRNMSYCHDALEHYFWDNNVLRQGALPKPELIRQFEVDGNAVLFATKSFWEGVSVEGDPLRLVIIDKIPFAPQTPLNTAEAANLREWARRQGVCAANLEWYPFNHMSVPRAIMDLKQGAGRLIRTGNDRGVIAILDPRLRTKRYGRDKILPSLPDATLTDSIEAVRQFYANHKKMGDPATSMEIFGLMAAEEMAF